MTIPISRRQFISALGGTAVGRPLAAHAQQGVRMRRIGVLTFSEESDRDGQSRLAEFRSALAKLGGRKVPIFGLNFAGAPPISR